VEVDEHDSKDLLSYLVRSSLRQGQTLSIDELLDHISTFVLAGHETTSTAIAYTVHALSRDQGVQDRLRAELDDFGKELTYDDLLDGGALPYLDAMTKEAMRIFPAGAHNERTALFDDVLPLKYPVTTADGTLLHHLRIKKGQLIYAPALSINTQTSVWGPDGRAFRPERWLPSSPSPVPDVAPGGWQHLATFGEGPRFCIGYRLAVFEFKAILAALVRAVRFEDAGFKVESKCVATLQPYVVDDRGEDMKGPWLPVRVKLVDQE